MDFTLYWFMFPVATLIAIVAMLSGIAGAALSIPVFLLVFPYLGAEYVLANPLVAIVVALLNSTFGFASGYIGYQKRKLIDIELAKRFLLIAIPSAMVGVVLIQYIPIDKIRLIYGVFMLILAMTLLLGLDFLIKKNAVNHEKRKVIICSQGQRYEYFLYKAKLLPTVIGGILTGMLSTGIGEVTMPQLIKVGKVPVPVAAATSVLIILCTFVIASSTHVYVMVKEGGLNVIPWHLVCYTIPGVIIGGQIGPRLQGRIDGKSMERGVAIVFVIVGIAMIWAGK